MLIPPLPVPLNIRYSMLLFWILLVGVNSNISNSRIPRDSSDSRLQTFTNNFKRLARLTNGISLEIGLIDGSLQLDPILQELLHLGSINFKDLSDLDLSTVSGSVSKLEEVSKNFDSSKDVTDIEKRFAIFEEIRVSKHMDDFVALPGKNEYRSLLDDVEKLGGINVNLNLIKTRMSQLSGSFVDLELWAGDSLTEEMAKNAIPTIGAIPSTMINVETAVNDFEPMRKIWSRARSLQGNSTFLEILYTESYIRGNLSDRLKFGNKDVMGKVLKNVEKLFELRGGIGKAKVDVIQKFLESKSSGLSTEKSTLEALKSDIEDPWISVRISNTSEKLKTAISSFNPVIVVLAKVEEDWKALEEDSARKSSKSFIDSQLEILKIPEDSKPILAVIQSLTKCEIDRQSSASKLDQELEKVFSLIKDLNGKIANIGSLDYIEELKDLKSLKSFLSVKQGTSESNVQFIGGIAKKIIADPKFRTVRRALKKFEADLLALTPLISEIPPLVSEIKPEFDNVDTYQKGVNNTFYTKFYDCVKQVGESGARVKLVFDNVEEVRDIGKSKDLDTTKSVIQAIQDSQKDLKSLKDTVENLKKAANPEALALKNAFPDFQKVSKNLNKATQGLKAIGLALEARNSLNSLLDSKVIEKVINLAKSLDSEDLKIIQKTSDLKEALSGCFQKIDEFLKVFQEARKRRNVPNFVSIGKILEAASKISDVKFDIGTLKQALGSLEKTSQIPELSELSNALDSLKLLDLEFSKFEFKNAIPSLEALDTFFVSYSKKSTSSALPTPQPRIAQLPTTSMGTTSQFSTTPEYSYWEDPLTYVYLLLAILGTIGGAAVAYFLIKCLCCKKKIVPDIEVGGHSPASQNNKKVKSSKPNHRGIKGKSSKKTETTGLLDSKGSVSTQENPVLPKVDSNTGSQSSDSNHLSKVSVEEKVAPLEKDKEKTSHKSKVSGDSKVKTPTPEPPKIATPGPSAIGKIGVKSQDDPLPWLTEVVDGMDSKLRVCLWPIEYVECAMKRLILENDNKMKPGQVLLNENDRIYSRHICHPDSTVAVLDFEDSYINMNKATFGTRNWFIGQMPMNGTEREKGKLEPKNNTIPKYLALIIQAEVGTIIQSTPFVNKEGKKDCARFYSNDRGGEMPFDDYKVITISKDEHLATVTNPNNFTKFQLEVKNSKSKKSQIVDVYCYDWPEDSSPEDIEDALDILKICDASKGHVMLLCYYGLGPSGTLLGIKFGIELCMERKVDSLDELIKPVRDTRFKSIRNKDELFYFMSCVAKGYNRRMNVKPLKSVCAINFYYSRYLNGFYNKQYTGGGEKKEHYDVFLGETKKLEEDWEDKEAAWDMLPGANKKDEKGEAPKVVKEEPKKVKKSKDEKGKTEAADED